MNYLEIIELRSGSKDMKFIQSLLTELLRELNKVKDDYQIKMYVNAKVENDFSIHILHKGNKNGVRESAVGTKLLSILKEFVLNERLKIWAMYQD